MLVPISEIKINAGRREADPEGVRELVDSISKVGLLNPITIDQEHTLIAGLHRLEAANLADTLIDRVYVYPNNQVEIVWKMKDFSMEAM